MPWRQKTMKDVAACDKPREGGKQPVIRGFPNGETHPDGRSGYPVERSGGQPGEVKHLSSRRKREQEFIPLVVASETGTAKTRKILTFDKVFLQQ